MQKIYSCLWFEGTANQAAEFYISVFKADCSRGKIAYFDKASSEASGQPEGSVLTVQFKLFGQDFLGLNGGPIFKINPSISFLVACNSHAEVDEYWEKLSPGSTALMELGKYPFSDHYGWLMDKFGVSWQIMHVGDRKIGQKITPTLMFVGDVCGKAEEAINFYTSIFQNSTIGDMMRYEKGESIDKPGTIKHAQFTLDGSNFAAMDSAYNHAFKFNEAHSFIINCKDQNEIDYFWGKLSHVPESEQCGWLKDKFGISWQVNPIELDKMMADSDEKKRSRVMRALLNMHRIDLNGLKKAFEGVS